MGDDVYRKQQPKMKEEGDATAVPVPTLLRRAGGVFWASEVAEEEQSELPESDSQKYSNK